MIHYQNRVSISTQYRQADCFGFGFKVDSFLRCSIRILFFHLQTHNLQDLWIIILYKTSSRLWLRLKLERDWRKKNNFMNLWALGMISSYICLDVPFPHTTTFLCIEPTGTETKIISCSPWESRNHMIILPKIKDACFNPKHLKNTFSGREFLGTKEKRKSHNQMRWGVKQHFLMTQLNGEWFLKSRPPRGGASSLLLYLHLQCGNTCHLGNKYSSSLSIVTIVKHVTSHLWCSAKVCFLHGAEDKTDYSLHW